MAIIFSLLVCCQSKPKPNQIESATIREWNSENVDETQIDAILIYFIDDNDNSRLTLQGFSPTDMAGRV
jgi:hypothetical protein